MNRYLFIASLLFALTAEAQMTDLSEIWKEHEFKGEQLFNDGLYEAAIDAYQKQLVDDPNNSEAIIRIAQSYKHLGDYKLAGHYFHILGRSYQLDEKYREEYADVLLAEGSKDEALEQYRTVLKNQPDDDLIKAKISGLENWDEFFKYEDYAIIESVSFNSAASEFGVRKYGSGLAFTSSRIKDGLVQHNYLREITKLTAIYTVSGSDSTDVELLTIDKYKKSNDGPHAVFGYDYVISRSMPDPDNKSSRLGLFFFQIDDEGKLNQTAVYPFNSPEYSLMHPAFNSSGDTLFFSSDIPSGYGGFDIYYSINRNNQWSAPVNLGELVNTRKNEIFPFMDGNNFYFSSNGHAGLGGIDIYKLVKSAGEYKIENPGSPVNSGWDDFALSIKGAEGFLSSNRPGGQGLDDIYTIKLLPRPKVVKPVQVSLSFLDNFSDSPIDAAEVKLVSQSGTVEVLSNKQGKVNQQLMPGDYTVMVKRQPYVDLTFNLTIEEDQPKEDVIGLEPAITVHIVSPDSIMFKFGEYNLLHEDADEELDAIAETMLEYPEFSLEISAHTDSRGSHDYNKWLSERRAETAAKYIIERGIDSARIHQYGYGETKLLNNCRDGVSCGDGLHAVNRRLEFDFIRNDSEEK